MHRVDADGHQNHRFFDGNSTGAEPIPATVISAEWLNDVQETLCKLIECRGGIPTKGDDEQLVKLIGVPLSTLEKELETLKTETPRLIGEALRLLEKEIAKLKEEVAKLWVKVG